MSYDLAVWDDAMPASDSEALVVYQDLVEVDAMEDPLPAPTEAVRAFVAAVVQRWPETLGGAPWADEPVLDGAFGSCVVLHLSLSRHTELVLRLGELAEAHGLVCFDPQTERLVPERDDAHDDLAGLYDETVGEVWSGTLPVGCVLEVPVDAAADLLDISPVLVSELAPRLRPVRGALDFPDLLLLRALADDDRVPAGLWSWAADEVRCWWASRPDLTAPVHLVVDEGSVFLESGAMTGAGRSATAVVLEIAGQARTLLEQIDPA